MPVCGPFACLKSSRVHGQPNTTPCELGRTVYITDKCLDTHEQRSVLCKGYLDALGQVAAEQTDTREFQHKDQQRQLPSFLASDSFAITTAVMARSLSSDDSVSASDVLTSQAQDVRFPGKLRGASAHKIRMQQILPNRLLGVQKSHLARAAPVASTGCSTLYPYIHQHGRSIMSLSTLQQGLQHFIVPGVGYIAYAMMYNGPPVLNIKTAVALGDPVCDPQQYQDMAAAFLKQHPKAMFAQVSKDFAEVLQASGLLVNSLGGETHLDLRTFTISGYAKRGLRSCIASAVKEGYTVQEVLMHTAAAADVSAGTAQKHGFWSALTSEMQEVDRLWSATKGQKASRVWFLNRPPVFHPEPGVRKFAARDGSGRLQAFIFFDAVYDRGQITGYYANVTRMRPGAHPGVLNLIIKEVIDRLRSEAGLSEPPKRLSIKKSQRRKQQQQTLCKDTTAPGATESADAAAGCTMSSNESSELKFLSLGLSPFHQRDDSAFKHSTSMKSLMQFMYKHGTGFYPFKSLAAAKAKYGAGLHGGRYDDPNVTYNQVYLAHSHRNNTAAVVALFDFTVMLGMLNNPVEAVAGLLAYKVKRRVKSLRKPTSATHQ